MRRLLLIAGLFAACAPYPVSENRMVSFDEQLRATYDPLIRHLTYESAVVRFGSPIRKEVFDNGVLVGTWQRQDSSMQQVTSHGTICNVTNGNCAISNSTTSIPVAETEEVVLTFGPDGLLTRWSWRNGSRRVGNP
jgi:hypothetical protein